MRAVELAKVAANAEKLRLTTQAKRQATRAVFGAVAAVFAIGLLIMLHVIGYILLRQSFTPVISAVIVLAVDLVIALVCGILAMRNTPSAIEREALDIRKQAVKEMKTSLTVLSMVGPASRLLGGRRSTGLALGALATRLLARR